MSIVYFIVVCVLLFLIVEAIAILFNITGLEMKKARFQVVSIITHTGFTTKESELIAKHPVRRRFATILMLVSYVAQISLISFLFSIIQKQKETWILAIVIVCGGVLLYLFWNKYLFVRFEKFIKSRIFSKMIKKSGRKSFDEILEINQDYGVSEIVIGENSPLRERFLHESRLKERYIQVLSIDKGDRTIPFPVANYRFEENDRLIVYGLINEIIKLSDENKED